MPSRKRVTWRGGGGGGGPLTSALQAMLLMHPRREWN